ncbi:5'-3' exoribonuclease 2 [Spironucleus salmonicida]|uniref:5'-3' exoribonuclease 2 n=1 Tax=Spironucleus salmonicida TaxID=348837 RepID=V6LQB9_9EUKA|nr:5'-3' exoribonuclease 2 [Spironucleus salmonicida]|eukprot:EST46443.1 5'-3' exoribonuclease 2 [Spironucleus salmonicida]
MEVPRFVKFLQFRYPQALQSYKNNVKNSNLYVNLQQLAFDSVSVNSYCNIYTQTESMSIILESLLQLVDKFNPINLVLYLNPIFNEQSIIKCELESQYKLFYQQEAYNRQPEDKISFLDFVPKSQFMRTLIVFLTEQLQFLIKNQVRISFQEDYNLVNDIILQNKSNSYVYGVDTSQRLKFLYQNLPVKVIVVQQPIYEKPLQDVVESNITFCEYGIWIQDFKSLRELIICDLLQDYLNSQSNMVNLYQSLYDEIVNVANIKDSQNIRQKIFEHSFTKALISDFIALVLFSGCSYLPEMPGQTFKNGLLDQLIEYYQKNNLLSYPFFNIVQQENQKINYFTIQQIFKIMSKNELLWVINDIKEVNKLNQLNIDQEYKGALKYDLQTITNAITQESLNKITTLPLGKVLSDYQLSNQVLRFYKTQYYKKVCAVELIEERILNLDQIQHKNYDIIALYDLSLNLALNQQPSDEVNKILEANQWIGQYQFTVNMIRDYFKSFQSILFSIFNNSNQYIVYPYKFALFSSLISQYCEAFIVQSANIKNANLLWDYQGPSFLFEKQANNSFYKQIPKSLLFKFVPTEQTQKWTEIKLENFQLKHTISPFLVRNMKLNGKYPNLSTLGLSSYQYENLGFQNFQFDERSVVVITDKETLFLKEDNEALDLLFQPLQFVLTSYIKNKAEFKNYQLISCQEKVLKQSYLPQESFKLDDNVFLYCKQPHIFLQGANNQQPPIQQYFSQSGLQFNQNLQILTENIQQISKLNSKFSIISHDYQSTSILLTTSVNSLSDEIDTISETDNKFEIFPEELTNNLVYYFGDDILNIFTQQISGGDIVGNIIGIIYGDQIFDLKNNQVLKQHDVKGLLKLAKQYFYANKGYIYNDNIHFIVSDCVCDINEVLKQQVHMKNEPFVSSLSIFDDQPYSVIPMSLIDRDQSLTHKLSINAILSGNSICVRDIGHLSQFFQFYQIEIMNKNQEILTLQLAENMIQQISKQLFECFKYLIPIDNINQCLINQNNVDVINQIKYYPIQDTILNQVMNNQAQTVTLEYLQNQIGFNITEQQINKLMGSILISCPDNATRELGMCANFDDIIDLSLISIDHKITYKGAVIIIAFSKAFPDLFKQLLPLLSKTKIDIKDFHIILNDKPCYCIKPSEIIFGDDYPFSTGQIQSTDQFLYLITQSSYYLQKQLINRHHYTLKDSLNLNIQQITEVKKLNISCEKADFILNIFEVQQNAQQIKLLDTIFVPSIGVGILVEIGTTYNKIVVNGITRFIHANQQIWQISSFETKTFYSLFVEQQIEKFNVKSVQSVLNNE